MFWLNSFTQPGFTQPSTHWTTSYSKESVLYSWQGCNSAFHPMLLPGTWKSFNNHTVGISFPVSHEVWPMWSVPLQLLGLSTTELKHLFLFKNLSWQEYGFWFQVSRKNFCWAHLSQQSQTLCPGGWCRTVSTELFHTRRAQACLHWMWSYSAHTELRLAASYVEANWGLF